MIAIFSGSCLPDSSELSGPLINSQRGAGQKWIKYNSLEVAGELLIDTNT